MYQIIVLGVVRYGIKKGYQNGEKKDIIAIIDEEV